MQQKKQQRTDQPNHMTSSASRLKKIGVRIPMIPLLQDSQVNDDISTKSTTVIRDLSIIFR